MDRHGEREREQDRDRVRERRQADRQTGSSGRERRLAIERGSENV